MKSYLSGSLITLLGLFPSLLSAQGTVRQEDLQADTASRETTVARFIAHQTADNDIAPRLDVLPPAFFNSVDETIARLEHQMDTEQAIYFEKLKAKVEMERQARDFEIQEKNRTVELAQVRQHNLESMLSLGSLVSLLLFLFLLWSRYNQYRQNQRLALEVRNRTTELEQKNQQLEEAYHALEQVSMRDALTGLYNRNFLSAQLPGEISRVQHHYASIKGETFPPNHDLLCFLIDIDHFKQINDEYGHLAGDRFLVQFTGILKEVFRQTDLLIRWGGEEFLAVCRNANRNDMVELADRLIEAVRQKRFHLPDDVVIHATCSVGFCAMPLCRRNPYEMDWVKTFAVMDYCLYAAKISQRDCWVGAIEACKETDNVLPPSPLEGKFSLTDVQIKTSLNNLASIEWPME